jgi:uncharacterized protein
MHAMAHETTPPAPVEGTLRRCIVSGESGLPETMLRFVIGPDDQVVPDLARRLPGRGMWVTAHRDLVARAVVRQHFSRAARRAVRADVELAERVERLLFERVLDLVGLARRAGRAVAGMAKVEQQVRLGRVALVLVATDAGADGRRQLGGLKQAMFADAATLGAIFGRDAAVYVAIADERSGPGFATRIADAVARWNAYRQPPAGAGGN